MLPIQPERIPPPSISLEELSDAYFSCRTNKRRTATDFEVNYEDSLVALWREINDGSYQPERSLTFIVNKRVKREIGDFALIGWTSFCGSGTSGRIVRL